MAGNIFKCCFLKTKIGYFDSNFPSSLFPRVQQESSTTLTVSSDQLWNYWFDHQGQVQMSLQNNNMLLKQYSNKNILLSLERTKMRLVMSYSHVWRCLNTNAAIKYLILLLYYVQHIE